MLLEKWSGSRKHVDIIQPQRGRLISSIMQWQSQRYVIGLYVLPPYFHSLFVGKLVCQQHQLPRGWHHTSGSVIPTTRTKRKLVLESLFPITLQWAARWTMLQVRSWMGPLLKPGRDTMEHCGWRFGPHPDLVSPDVSYKVWQVTMLEMTMLVLLPVLIWHLSL